MRDFEKPGRSEAFGLNGMAATSHPQATLTAIDVLKSGGNAVDAAVAAAAVLGVVEPTQTGIGGDCFVLLKREGQSIIALNGSGQAPAGTSFEHMDALGPSALAAESVHSVTVPGAVGAWEKLVQDHGTQEWRKLLAPAIAAAAEGYPVTERLARDWGRQLGKLSRHASTAAIFLPNGSAPVAGNRHAQRALARTLEDIAAHGAKAFYEGWIAEDIVGELNRLGGFHAKDDFAAYVPRYVSPICAPYRDHQIWECPPNGSGIAVLAMARLLERYDVGSLKPDSAERYHLLAEVARIAYAERDAYVGDTDKSALAVERLLSDSRVDAWLKRLSVSGRISDLKPLPMPEHKDTVFLSVVDRDRTAISFINSIFDDFGSGIVAPKSGVLLHNRGSGFVLERGHPNAFCGGKRPMHTILPAMLTREGEVEFSFGVTGGHFQPIGQMQLISNVLDYGMSIQEAIDFPRVFARGDVLEVEHTISPTVIEAFEKFGHRPTLATNPLGTAQAIWIDRKRGILRGGADPRRDGITLGY